MKDDADNIFRKKFRGTAHNNVDRRVPEMMTESLTWVREELERLLKTSPGAALAIAAAGGAAAAFLALRAISPSPPRAEEKIRDWVRNARDTYDDLEDAVDNGFRAVKSLIEVVNRHRRG